MIAVRRPSRRNKVMAKPRSGWALQRERRHAERTTRQRVVGFVQWARSLGLKLREVTKKLGLCVRTVTDWLARWTTDRLKLCARGRPLVRANREERCAILATIEALGPGVGVEVLKGRYPKVARSAIQRLLRRARYVWQKKNRIVQGRLTWQKPGRTWAMDFTEPASPVDGKKAWVLAARDLSSGNVLLAEPHEHADHEASLVALKTLFARHGAPLVIKTDNGGHFRAEAVEAFLRSQGVLLLPSPPYYPQYNGAIEAGMGSIEGHADWAAYLAGRPGQWSSEDLVIAKSMANEFARPRGANGPTPKEAWLAREPITDQERAAFLAEYQAQEVIARKESGIEENVVLARARQDKVDRIAMQRALVEHRILVCQRRVITPAIKFRR